MYKEDCIYYKWWRNKIRACICSARSKEEGFTNIVDEIFPDCTNCKYYVSSDNVKERIVDIMKIGSN